MELERQGTDKPSSFEGRCPYSDNLVDCRSNPAIAHSLFLKTVIVGNSALCSKSKMRNPSRPLG
jgi:hypothetical protein